MSSNVGLQSVKGRPTVELKLDHKDAQAEFTIDAARLIWDYEIVSRAPTLRLFSMVKPGLYDLRLQMSWEGGSCESGKIRLRIAPLKALK